MSYQNDRYTSAYHAHYSDTLDWETPVLVLACVGYRWGPPIFGGMLLEHFEPSQPWRVVTTVLALGWIFIIGPAILRTLSREQ